MNQQAETVIEPWEPSSESPPSFVHAYRWWRAHIDAGRLPSRSDFDPVDHRSLLGWIVLFDVVRRERDTDFRYRLWGSEITTLVGRDHTGRLHSEVVSPDAMAFGRRCFFWVMEHKLPQVVQQRVPFEGRKFLTYERLALPLSNCGAEVDRIMLVVHPPKSLIKSASPFRLPPDLLGAGTKRKRGADEAGERRRANQSAGQQGCWQREEQRARIAGLMPRKPAL